MVAPCWPSLSFCRTAGCVSTELSWSTHRCLLEKRCQQQCPLEDYCHRVTLPSSKGLLGSNDQDGLVVMDGNIEQTERWLARPHWKPTGSWGRAVKSRAVPRQPSQRVLSARLCLCGIDITRSTCTRVQTLPEVMQSVPNLEENKNWNDS